MEDNFLPDLTEKKRQEDIDFDNKVKNAQIKFEKTMTGYLNWLKSPEVSRTYPTWAKNNKHSFRVRVKRFSYDHGKDVLFRVMQNNDFIGIYFLFNFSRGCNIKKFFQDKFYIPFRI